MLLARATGTCYASDYSLCSLQARKLAHKLPLPLLLPLPLPLPVHFPLPSPLLVTPTRTRTRARIRTRTRTRTWYPYPVPLPCHVAGGRPRSLTADTVTIAADDLLRSL